MEVFFSARVSRTVLVLAIERNAQWCAGVEAVLERRQPLRADLKRPCCGTRFLSVTGIGNTHGEFENGERINTVRKMGRGQAGTGIQRKYLEIEKRIRKKEKKKKKDK